MSLTVAGATALAAGLAAAGQAAAIGGQAAANTRVARLQNEFNIDMWNRTNEYNSPQAQMQRLSEAGLNPNLIYGNVNTGNTSPAQQVAPQAPDIQRGMNEITKAFNVQNLMLLNANRKKAEADAENAQINATRNGRQLFAEQVLGTKYGYDYNTGQFFERPLDPNGQVTVLHPSAYYINKALADNYNRAHLIPYRAALLESQKNYLAPQIWMENYNRKFYPVSYWIGQGTKAIGGISDLGGMFFKMPKFSSTPKSFNRNTTFNNYYNY